MHGGGGEREGGGEGLLLIWDLVFFCWKSGMGGTPCQIFFQEPGVLFALRSTGVQGKAAGECELELPE